uniref:SLC41A/MgtE integral membrane domain-containing protein n=1 Tax=Strigamia maritima TaxID=126957 RepID=T1JLE6_STRMM
MQDDNRSSFDKLPLELSGRSELRNRHTVISTPMVPKTERDDDDEEEEEKLDPNGDTQEQHLLPYKHSSIISIGRKVVLNGATPNFDSTDIEELELQIEDGYHHGKIQPLCARDRSEERDIKVSKTSTNVHEEAAWSIALQVFIPFLIAGFGMVGAGIVLDIVQHWAVFKEVTEVFILVPALLGLKGNLEMTLASRLSTQANLGNMDKRSQLWSMIISNMALIQCQAGVVGFLASLAAMIMGWIPEGEFNLDHAFLLCASSLVTASVARCIMVGVVILSRRCHINPDNVATPIAASLGDLTTLALLSGIATFLFNSIGKHDWLAPVIIVIFLMLTPVWAWLAKRNKYTADVLYTGWTPVIVAMAISSAGGLILDFTVSNFKGIAVFQPVINGVGGNLVAVQASRLSTSLHQESELGTLPANSPKVCANPCSAYFGNNKHARTVRVLMLMVIPGHLIFMYTISYIKAGHTTLTPVFTCVYLMAATIQVLLLFYIANVMVHWMWQREIDPDSSAIPYLTAIGDLLGTGLLAVAFQFLFVIGDKDSDMSLFEEQGYYRNRKLCHTSKAEIKGEETEGCHPNMTGQIIDGDDSEDFDEETINTTLPFMANPHDWQLTKKNNRRFTIPRFNMDFRPLSLEAAVRFCKVHGGYKLNKDVRYKTLNELKIWPSLEKNPAASIVTNDRDCVRMQLAAPGQSFAIVDFKPCKEVIDYHCVIGYTNNQTDCKDRVGDHCFHTVHAEGYNPEAMFGNYRKKFATSVGNENVDVQYELEYLDVYENGPSPYKIDVTILSPEHECLVVESKTFQLQTKSCKEGGCPLCAITDDGAT